jgi:molybdopterin-guanine dinucleotide biosynthesis adapter protein
MNGMAKTTSNPRVFQVVGYKNAGKTTLVCKLVHVLKTGGFRVGTVKHDAHQFEIDHPGKDTWQHREAGADAVAITSERQGQSCVIEQRYIPLPDLVEQISKRNQLDVVAVEGFKAEAYPKVAIIRNLEHLKLLNSLNHVKAIASWLPEREIRQLVPPTIPIVSIDDPDKLLAVLFSEEGNR